MVVTTIRPRTRAVLTNSGLLGRPGTIDEGENLIGRCSVYPVAHAFEEGRRSDCARHEVGCVEAEGGLRVLKDLDGLLQDRAGRALRVQARVRADHATERDPA